MPHKRDGSPYWWITYTDEGGRRIRETSRTTDYREAAALESKRKYETHQRKTWGREPERAFEELLYPYLQQTTAKRSHDRDKYSAKHLYEFFKGRELAGITPQDISDYKRQRAESGAKPATITKELQLFSGATTYARREWGWNIENVVRGRMPPRTSGRLRWLTRGEYAELINAARQSKAPYLADFIKLAVNTGMRRGEMLYLEWSRVDFSKRLIYLQPEDNKGGSFQSVPLNTLAVEALRAQLGGHRRWVFSRKSKRLQSIKKSFSGAVRAAGLEGVTIHTLRHTCAAWLVQAGVPIRTVSGILRHRDIRTTMLYAHLAPESVHDGVKALECDEIVTNASDKVTTIANLGKIVTEK